MAADAGRAALVQARAAQAYRLCGDSAAAERMLKQARAGAAGTAFAAEVESILAMAAQAAQDPAELDPRFLKLLEEQLAAKGWWDLSRYGRRLQPYLLSLLERDLVSGQVVAQRQLHLAFAVGDPAFLEKIEAVVEASWHPGLRGTLAQAFVGEPIDDQAAAAKAEYLIRSTRSEEISRARIAVEHLAGWDHKDGTERTRARLREILADPDDLLAPFIVPAMELETGGDSELLREACFSAQPLVAEDARLAAFLWVQLESLALCAEQGDVLDQRRLAWLLVPHTDTGQRREKLSDGQDVDFRSSSRVARQILDQEVKDRRPLFGTPGLPQHRELDREDWADWIHRLVESEDPWTRRFAELAAVGHEDWPLVAQLLRRAPAERAADLVRSLPPLFPESLDDALTARVEEGRLGELCAIQLLLHTSRLSYEQAARLDRASGVPENACRSLFQRWADDEEGRAHLERWGRSTDQRILSRIYAHEALKVRAPERLGFGFDLLLELGPQEHWAQQVTATLAEHWSRALRASAAARGQLEPSEIERLVTLGRICYRDQGRKSYNGQWRSTIIDLLERGLPGSFEVYEALLADPESRDYFVDIFSFRGNPPLEGARVARLLLQGDMDVVAKPLRDLLEGPEAEEVAFLLLESERGTYLTGQALRALATASQLSPDREDFIASFLSRPDCAGYAAQILAEKQTHVDRVPAMVAAWSLPGHELRVTLIRALGQTLDERVVPVLLEGLADKEERVAEAAAEALDRLKRLREARQNWEAWQKFGMHQSPTAALLDKLDSDNAEVRLAAIASLGTMKAVEALPFLIELLESEDPATVEAARSALAKINAG